ncbi:TPA: MFS transporter, partial [Salmonella enterica]
KLSEVYNIPLNQVGMILSAEVGFLALAMLFSGTLSDRFGRKPIIFYSLLAGGILTLLCATASSWPMLVVYRALLGIAVSGITAAVTVYISEEVSPALAGIVTGYFIFGNSLGSMSGRVFATLMMEHVSIDTIFFIFGGVLIAMALAVKLFLPTSRQFVPTPSLQLGAVLKGGLEHFKNIRVSLCFVIGFILFGSFTSIFNFLAFYLHRPPYELSYTWIGLIPVSFSLTFFLAPYAARVALNIGSMNALSMLIICMMVGAFLTLIAPSLWVFISGIVLLSVAFFSAHSTVLAWVSSRSPNAKGQATSFYLLCYYSGGAVMGYLNGYLFSWQGWNAIAASCLMMLGIGLFICRFIFAKYEKQPQIKKQSVQESF